MRKLDDTVVAEMYAAMLCATKTPLESWPAAWVISDFGNGRTRFKATDEEMAAHWVEALRSGRLQAFLRKFAVNRKRKNSRAAVEALITSLEKEFLSGRTKTEPQISK